MLGFGGELSAKASLVMDSAFTTSAVMKISEMTIPKSLLESVRFKIAYLQRASSAAQHCSYVGRLFTRKTHYHVSPSSEESNLFSRNLQAHHRRHQDYYSTCAKLTTQYW